MLGAVRPSEMAGICIGPPPWWRIEGARDAVAFYRALPVLLPEGVVLCFEGTIGDLVPAFLAERPSPHYAKVRMGTIWPRPDVHHMQLTQENLQGLVAILETGIVPYPSHHFHAYKENRVLLSWYDAFADPMLISMKIGEETVKQFSGEIGCVYSLVRASRGGS